VPTLWTCRGQRFAESEAEWVTWSQAGHRSYPGFCSIFFRVSEQVLVMFDFQPFYRICMLYAVCLVIGILAPVRSAKDSTTLPNSLSTGDTDRNPHRLHNCDAVCSQ
jgi:hypothetical protein